MSDQAGAPAGNGLAEPAQEARSEVLPPSGLALVLTAAVLVLVLAISAAWWLGVVADRNALGGLSSVQALAAIEPAGALRWVLAAIVAIVLATLIRRRGLITSHAVAASLALGLFSVSAALISPLGHHASLIAMALVGATIAAMHLPRGTALSADFARQTPVAADLPNLAGKLASAASDEPASGRDRWIAAGLWLAVIAVFATFSMHRHYWMGSGSWDMGCMIHNVYRASRFLDSTSTVLGEVDYLGDHFMIGIYLLAPIFWINSSGYSLLLIQSTSLAATAPAIYLIARRHQAPRAAAAILALSAALAFGLQSAAYFDIHEITLGFGFLAFALYAIEARRLRLASLLIALFALFKESLGAYVVGLGLLLVWRGIRGRDRRHALYGTAWIALGAIWFVLVNRIFMPLLIARANPPEAHETFADFGPTIFQALIGILTHPLRALGAIFIPQDKLHSLLVTFGGLGWLALASPELLLAALPLFAERFLSSKQTMWEMGYHYAAPLALYAAWSVAVAWPKLERAAARALAWLAPTETATTLRANTALAVYVAASTALINTFGYRHAANFHRFSEPYFSTPDRRASNARAIALLEAEPAQAKLAVQNRMLPHLANRPYIYRLGDYPKADFVLLDVAESAWPWDDGFPARLARQLFAAPDWRLIFAERETAVFARAAKTDRPEVDPSPELRLPPRPKPKPPEPAPEKPTKTSTTTSE